jgi:3-oxoadipate enol-lactonase
MATQCVSVRGVELAYEVSGTGPDLIWGHGLTLDRTSDAAMGLLDWGRIPASVVRYDARGHGASGTTLEIDTYSWLELARDQLALAHALGISAYVAAGASMGCGTALHAAMLGPEKVKALVLALPPTAWEKRAAQATQWNLMATMIESEGLEAFLAARAAFDPPDPFVRDEEYRVRQAAAVRAWEPNRLALIMRGATVANLPDRADIAALHVPALILAWTGDPIHPLETAEELQSLLPEAELHVASSPSDLRSWTDLTGGFLRRVLES